ncbi:MAG: exodeoxyribonuclease III [Sediminibacterium sp. Gen4]|jgi:exodeoxyribonuclease III|uniref:exodeoxyribonuclease III n=1 Tax=unclassified Sediminibacterium TaxID=2635961 RepID=UPI0015BA393D|nr:MULTISPECIES: exodeoxyribonuclease III [unclassified Sediminibacterium]MBW0156060.1 exodeoxyribonuclease III [Candidatus Methylopumilus sp.]MBW0163957.1 exodeoxyribonuclease III [Sediminibacterium sp.]NWK65882.1 exodeoxyribonuclease III [Sediminibacterium sp. Gen4]
MRIISYNVNGIRAAMKKGFIDWLATNPADVICLQETKANQEDVDVSAIEKMGYQTFWYSAQKKGYSGVAIFTKIKPDQVLYGNGIDQSDAEGRIIRADFGDITLINAYFPSGTSGEERQTYKYQWLDEFFTYVQELRKKRKKLIVTGDYNIAHTEIDIHDPKGNKKSSGFLPEERAWMDQFLANKWVDTFRHLHPEATGAYSWWSQRFPSVRLQNKGWRIDYISITDTLAPQLKAAAIYPDVKHSDHCPIYAEII